MRLIDADALKKAIDELFESGGYDSGLVMNTIDNAPTVEPKRPQGDLISREALKKCAISCEIHNGALTELCVPLYQIDNAPTINLDKTSFIEGFKEGCEHGKKCYARPQGEWIGNAFNEHHCNICGHLALWEEEPDSYYEVQSRFCPNCGAEMQKGGAE